jgi:predicted Fe-Mo cluster-binding NifX family protein
MRPQKQGPWKRKVVVIMRICIPVEEDGGLESLPYEHFGSAPRFLLHDTDTSETKTICNHDNNHVHGACSPLKALSGHQIDAVIVGGMGARAVAGLQAMGVRVFRSQDGTAEQNIASYLKNQLEELTPENACTHHHACHG